MSRKLKGKLSNPVSGAAFTVRVVTRAVKTEAVEVKDGTLKVRLKASPAGDPTANEELLNFLADLIGVPAKDLEIVAGESGREKLITVAGVTTDDIETKFGSING